MAMAPRPLVQSPLPPAPSRLQMVRINVPRFVGQAINVFILYVLGW